MMSQNKLRGVLIGSGAVATALSVAMLKSAGVQWLQVYSPTLEHADALAGSLGCEGVDDLDLVARDADFYLVSVKDDAIAEIVSKVKFGHDALWMHTSGGVPADIFKVIATRYGVFYPLQTFSKGVDVEMSEVPMFIEGSDPLTQDEIVDIAKKISGSVSIADSTLRKRLHCAAVFACNFTNHLWGVSDEILRHNPGLDIKVLKPLLQETLRKAMTIPPFEAQTGPAMRGDTLLMESHKSMLTPAQSSLYDYMSAQIMHQHNVVSK